MYAVKWFKKNLSAGYNSCLSVHPYIKSSLKGPMYENVFVFTKVF